VCILLLDCLLALIRPLNVRCFPERTVGSIMPQRKHGHIYVVELGTDLHEVGFGVWQAGCRFCGKPEL